MQGPPGKLEGQTRSSQLQGLYACEPCTSSLVPDSHPHPFQLPSNAVPFPLRDPTQPSSDIPLAAHAQPMSTACSPSRFEATRAVHDSHAHNSAAVPLQISDPNTGKSADGYAAAATRMQQPQSFLSPPSGHHGLWPVDSPNGNMPNRDQGLQPYSSPESAQFCQARSPVGSCGMNLQHGQNSGLNAGESTPPRLSLIHISEPTRPY